MIFYFICMSTSDEAFFAIDAHVWEFRKANIEYKLLKGQGVK